MTLNLEIQSQADYDLLLQLLKKFEGIKVAAPTQKRRVSDTVAEENAAYTPKNKAFDASKYQGCWTYPATLAETEAKLQNMRAEWDRDFF